MSSSQFDDLLGDFGASSKTTPNGDDNSQLLLDFGGSSQTNGQVSSNGVNPLYDLESEDPTATSPQQQPASSNPLYDLDFNADNTSSTSPTAAAPASSNPLYDFENLDNTPATEESDPSQPAGQHSSDPFGDFENLAGDSAPAQDSSVDLLSGTDDNAPPPTSDDLLGDFNSEPPSTQQPEVVVDDFSNTVPEEDSGVQCEQNGSTNLLDDFTSSGVTETTTTPDQDQPAEEAAKHQEEREEEEKEYAQEEMKGEDDDAEHNVETLPDLVVKEEGDEDGAEVGGHDAEERCEEVAQEEAPQDEIQGDAGAQAEEACGEDYAADRREEDLEQYCIDREEETSEVSESADPGVDARDEEEVEERKGDDDQEVEEAKPEAEIVDMVDGHNDVVDDEIEGCGDVDVDMVDTGKNDDGEDQQPEEQVDDERDQISTKEEKEEVTPMQDEFAQEEPAQEEPPTEDKVVEIPPGDQPDDPVDVEQEKDDVAEQPEEEEQEVTAEQPAEAHEQEPFEVTTLTTTEDTPYQLQDTGFEEPTSPAQESTDDQWPPKDNIDQQVPEVTIQEEPVEPTSNLEEQEEVQAAVETPSDPEPAKQEPVAMATTYETQPQQQQWQQEDEEDDEEEEEGVYENEPVKRDDVARESDKKEDTNLPSPGLAQNLLAKFNTGTASNSTPRAKREITPPNPTMGGGEYVSEPRVVLEKYEGKTEAGVFENEPQIDPEVVRSDSHLDETLPEQGSAKKFAARYAQIDQEGKSTVVTSKKEITTDRDSGPVEYVSEPRGFVEHYEGKADSGVFESQPENMPDVIKSGEKQAADPIPERGTAKNLAQRFHQISVDSAAPVSSSSGRNKRELTPDQSGRTEYVSEPRTQSQESYETKVESGVFENTPQEDPEVVKSQAPAEEYVPERGYAKNVAAKFKQLESTAKSPPLSPGRRKEFTPPREDQNTSRSSGLFESTPESKPDVVTSSESQQEVMPGAGTAKSLAQRYKDIEAQSRTPVTSRTKKEITPPPNEAGVFENKPERFDADYNKPAESGILENTPEAQREDVLKSGDSSNNTGVDLPEAGSAKNLVNRWRQIESESAKNTSPGSAGRHTKEFTPPREEPRIMQNSKSPRTPKSPAADSSGHQLDNGSVHPSELPGQYQPQNEPSVFESTPEARPDALREADTDKGQGLPKKNQAKKMLARFQSIQAEANKETPKPAPKKQQQPSSPQKKKSALSPDLKAVFSSFEAPTPLQEHTPNNKPTKTPRKDPDSHPNSPIDTPSCTSTSSSNSQSEGSNNIMEASKSKFEDPDQVGRSKSLKLAVHVEKCAVCEKTVYALEKVEMNKRVYHRTCLRCSQCNTVLTPKTVAVNNEVIFCTTHYKQKFTTKGNYDEGFGRQQHKKQWKANPTNGTADTNSHNEGDNS